MTPPKTSRLIERLGTVGFVPSFAEQCLPEWWDVQAEESSSAWLQLRLDLAQQLSLDPFTLLQDEAELRFMNLGRTKFKHLALDEAQQRSINAFASGLARILLAALPSPDYPVPSSAAELRRHLIPDDPGGWIGLGQLLTACYTFGVPVAQLTAMPAGIKGMAAVTIGQDNRAAIFVARKPLHPAQTTFFIAHELGHMALGHVHDGEAIVDASPMVEPDDGPLFEDAEEAQADAYALELLTGKPALTVIADSGKGTAAELARIAIEAGQRLRIDPGLLLLSFGRSTGRWPQVTAALRQLPDYNADTTQAINRALRSQLDLGRLPASSIAYLDAVAAA